MPIRSSFAILIAGAALACLIQPASARTLQVGSCTSNPRQYATIQAAVNATNPGDKVQVCPGSYPEQVSITQAITLESVPGKASPTVTLPAGGATLNTTTLYGQPAAAQILVSTPGGSVNVENLIVDGTGFVPPDGGCQDEFLGIYYQNAGGTVSGNTTQYQQLPPDLQGCQDGEAIFAENQVAGTLEIRINGNTVTNFDKNGITVSYAAANAQIENNIVTGVGPTDVIAQNGIQVGYGATGTISGNTVSGMIYTPATYGSSGILLYDSQAGTYLTPPKISGNTVSTSQYGIVLDAVDGTPNSMVQIKSNGISGATFAGIGLYSDNSVSPPASDDFIKVQGNTISGTAPFDDIDACSDYNQIRSNMVSASSEGGIHLDGLCVEPDNSTTGVGNTVASNTIENNCVGILSGPAQGLNTISKSNHLSGNTQDYVYGQDSYSCTAAHRSRITAKGDHGNRLPAVQPR